MTNIKNLDLSDLNYVTRFTDRELAIAFATKMMRLGKDVAILNIESAFIDPKLGDSARFVDVYSDGKLDRVFKPDMVTLSNNSRCEACEGTLRDHEWADLDEKGFAVWCSEREEDYKK